MTHVTQKPRKRRGATGRMLRFFCPTNCEKAQKRVPMTYPIPIIHQKYTGSAMRPMRSPRRTSPPPTHEGRLSIFATVGMNLSAFFSPRSIFVIIQNGKKKGSATTERAFIKRFFLIKKNIPGIIICRR